ncbi:MAG: excinuclease ABC subunit UvrA [Pirellulaceae bacterium]|nr:excinuclease ABC subunit UvrA [Pirellulaceae bacterium]MDP7015547.1 excinuclease ABC subunit UvrA [Pirellulaceae bacterium]
MHGSDSTQSGPNGSIRIRGARTHNLRDVDLDIPRHQLIVMTGPSGSGKSSLAFDTLYAEGQRQYIESLSVYARQFLHQMERPDVDFIDGLQPTICIDQRPGSHNPRSTVATVTEVYDYLRLLMARLGEPECYQCGEPIQQQTPEQILDSLMGLPDQTKTMILAPMVRGRRGQHREILQHIRKAGFVRARIDEHVYEVDQFPELEPRKVHQIDAIVDRVIIREGIRSRVAESINLALRHGDGVMSICYLDEAAADDDHPHGVWRDKLFSTLYACPNCEVSYEELEPRTFSFNSPYGVCSDCEGFGAKEQFDLDLVIPDWTLSLADGAVATWRGLTDAALAKRKSEFKPLEKLKGFSWTEPFDQLRPSIVEKLVHGDGKQFLGLMTLLEKEYSTATRSNRLEALNTFRGDVVCPSCEGSRLRPESTSVRFQGSAIHEITRMTVAEAREFFQAHPVIDEDEDIAGPLIEEIDKRLEFLAKVGVDYLTLDRPAETLSGGELQRVRLATSIGSSLVGVCYVLDEPSIGLHPRDNERLISALRDLQALGNTVLIVEHDEAMMRAADQLIDIGPGAGAEGGLVIAQGTPADVSKDEASLTGRYLRGEEAIAPPKKRRRIAKARSLTVHAAATNNLREIDVRFPLGALVCVTGVSGSGKSSLVNETLSRALVRRLGGVAPKPGPHTGLRGASQVDKVIEIDQSPIGRSPRSNAATYTGAFDEIRKVFAGTRDSKQRGFRSSRFSFNVKGGRCEACQGQGMQKIEMSFLADLFVLCSECRGARFNRQTLQVRYRGKSIADVLEMSIDEAADFFENFAAIHRLMQSLQEVGMGYLKLGQPSTTLSGGEAQRIKLATQLARVDTGKTVYLLDEPTTGLHFHDIKKLLEVLQKLVDRGNTVIVIEHNLDVVKCADWIIDLGPEGGDAGGYVVAEGTPEKVAQTAGSHTGKFLAPLLGK